MSNEVWHPDLFAGKVVFCTGGSGSICSAQVEALVRLGANAVIVGRRADAAAAVATKIEAARPGSRVLGISGDVRNIESMAAAVSQTVQELGRIDFLICGAAGNFLAPFDKLSANAFKTVVDIDLIGSFNATKACADQLKKNRGRIIYLSATLHYAGTPRQTHAAAAKAGVDALSSQMCLEYGPWGVTSNVIAPGYIAGTEGLQRLSDRVDQAKAEAGIPLQRLGHVTDVANLTVFLLSPAAAYVTGTVVPVDGGQWRAQFSMQSNGYPDSVKFAYIQVSKTFASHRTKSLQWRTTQIRKVWWMLEDNKERIVEALYKDLHKHRLESITVDVCGIQTACLYTLKNLPSWAAEDRPQRFNLVNLSVGARVRKEPKGVALILSAWNYPFMELLEPMISAIAAGCCVILKPSEIAAASQKLIAEMLPQYLDQDAIRVLTAGAKEMDYIMQKRWDHVFFTGSTKVGRIIYQKAASYLTSVTLELGGQSPVIVSASADIDLAAKRIAAAKFMNAGQVCLTANHIFVDPTVKEQLIVALIKYFDRFLSRGMKSPSHYSHIVNQANFQRLVQLLDKTSGRVVYGGERQAETLFFSPTIVADVSVSDSLMSEELFGPILPILDATLDDAISYTAQKETPLALYAFTNSVSEKSRVLDLTSSGGVCINDLVVHTIADGAPFGGIGASGIGAYHGPYGFQQFTHLRTVADIPKWFDFLLYAKYPPYTDKTAAALATVFRPVDKVWFDREGKTTSRSLLPSRAFFNGFLLAVLALFIFAVREERWRRILVLLQASFN
ncbi:hypothetical protein ACJZ2D_016089 [Fusarium nematophilum]